MSRMARRAQLRGFIAHLQQVAADIITRGDQHSSIVVLLTPQGVQVEPLPVPEGQALNDVLRARLRATKAWGYIYINEAWTTTATAFAAAGGQRVLDVPPDDRQEELLMVGLLRGDRPLAYRAPIEATPSGRRLGAWASRGLALFLGDASIVPDW